MPEDRLIIAAAVGLDGSLAEIPGCERVLLFERGEDGFRESGALDFSFRGVDGLRQMRARLSELVGRLEGVAAVAAKGFPGVARDVLTRNGHVLYEIGGLSREVLEGIGEHLDRGEFFEPEEAPVAPLEKEEGSGVYFLDMRKALNANPDLSTKKILRPFFAGVRFKELEFICDHLPPWLPGELAALGLRHEARPADGGALVRVYAKEGQSE
ncbi:MAG: hypothetical protein LBW85_09235 [Deltaproteobacteria bacterium]|jgi:hypothetical protein|nr:hypothetical protein [Deltaproteobacteria bacterium]